MRRFTFSNLEIPQSDTLPEWLHLVPFGIWLGHHSTDEMKVTKKEAREILTNFDARQPHMLVIDYEHQTMNTGFNGQPAPAAGWIDRLELREDGVWGHVHGWTGKGAAHLKAKEYRYLSPVLYPDTADRRTGEPAGCWLSSVALTNVPFFAGDLAPVVNAATTPGGTSPMLLTLLSLLGLPKEGTEKDVTDGVTALKTERDNLKAEVEILKAAVPSDVEVETMKAACKAADLDPKKLPKNAPALVASALSKDGWVSAADHLKVLGELEQMKAGSVGDRVEQLACRAVESGKITPAMKPTFVAMARGNYAAACKYLDDAPVTVPLGSQVQNPPKAALGGLSPEEQLICSQLKITAEQFLATKAKQGGK